MAAVDPPATSFKLVAMTDDEEGEWQAHPHDANDCF